MTVTDTRRAAASSEPARGFRVLGALTLVIAIMAAGMAGGSVYDRLAHGKKPSGTIPDTILQMTYDQQARQENVTAYLPGTNIPYPLLDGGNDPLITPDGRQLIFMQRLAIAGGMQYAAVSFASDTLGQQWRTVFATGPADTQQTPGPILTSAVTDDRVYIASHRWQTSEPVTIIALNRADGQERARWSVELAGQYAGGISLRAAPDGASLALMANLDSGSGISPRSLFFRLRLPDGQEIQRVSVAQSGDNAFYWLNGAATPDGATLYQLSYGASPTSLVLRFFDLQSAALLPPLALPFAGQEDFLAYEQAIAHDGQRLYVLAPTLRSLVVVNLMTRRIEDQVQINTDAIKPAASVPLVARVFAMLRGFFVQDAAAKGPILDAMQLSPDGGTLYAAGAMGMSHNTQARGIWAIDTRSWRVTKRWLPDASPSTLLLSGDGRFLSMTEGHGAIRTLDTASGNEIFTTHGGTSGNDYAQTLSLRELYRQHYGRSPRLGAPARDRAPSPPFAALTATVNRNTVVTGDTVTIEARFTDPTGGAPVTPGMQGILYTPPAAVTAAFCPQGAAMCGPTISLTSVGYGAYRGSATLTDAGPRSVRVLATWNRDDLPNRQARIEDAVTVQAAFVGTDGNRYLAQVSTDPAPMLSRQEATIRVAFVDAARGTLLPEGVTLFGGLPPTLNADLLDTNGYLLELLNATGHGIYRGALRLTTPEVWRVNLQVPTGNGVVAPVPIGTITVASGEG